MMLFSGLIDRSSSGLLTLLAQVAINGAAEARDKLRDVVEEGGSALPQVAVQIMGDNDAGQPAIVDGSRAQVMDPPRRYVPAVVTSAHS